MVRDESHLSASDGRAAENVRQRDNGSTESSHVMAKKGRENRRMTNSQATSTSYQQYLGVYTIARQIPSNRRPGRKHLRSTTPANRQLSITGITSTTLTTRYGRTTPRSQGDLRRHHRSRDYRRRFTSCESSCRGYSMERGRPQADNESWRILFVDT